MDQNPPSTPQPAASAGEDKTVAIVAYLTFIGLIIAIILHGQKKTALGTYHLRQALGIHILGFGCWILNFVLVFIPILGWLLMFLIGVGLLIMWIMGLIAAANGEQKPVFLLGKPFQEWFKNAFN